MRTRVSVWLALAAALAVILGSLMQNPRAVLAAIPPLVYLFLANTILRGGPPRLEVFRTAALPRVYEGGEATIALTIRDAGKGFHVVEAMDDSPAELEVSQGGRHVIFTMHTAAPVTVQYVVQPRTTGHYELRHLRLRTSDVLGVESYVQEVEVPAYLTVLPLFEDIRRPPPLPRPRNLQLGLVKSRSIGTGSEFFSLRPYVVGDEFRRVNWKASARTGSLISNDFEWERIVNGFVLVDATPSAASVLPALIRAAASLLVHLSKGLNQVGLMVFKDVLLWVRPEAGKKHLLRVLDALIDVRCGEPYVFEYQRTVAMRLAARHPQIVLLSPLIDSRLGDFVGELRASGIEPTIVSPRLSPAAGSRPGIGALEGAIDLLRHDTSVMELTRRGFSVLEWDPTTPLSPLLEAVHPWRGRS